MTQIQMQPTSGIEIESPKSLLQQKKTHLLRIGAVSYLNTKPLVFGLEDLLPKCAHLSLALPSVLADELASSELDVGLIPVVEYFQDPSFRVVSDAAIACRGPVWSVRIFFRCDPAQVRTLALDEGSRTSAALSKVLFHKKFGYIPQTVPLRMADDPLRSSADAVLVIGDRAMHPEQFRPSFTSDWDLGQIWFEETGLPFVFAMWVARCSDFLTDSLSRSLEESRDRGLANIHEIAVDAASRYQLTVGQCEDYLTNYIRFFLRTDELAGLEEFRRRCDELGLVSKSKFRTTA